MASSRALTEITASTVFVRLSCFCPRCQLYRTRSYPLLTRFRVTRLVESEARLL
jgi:hypothetical protein